MTPDAETMVAKQLIPRGIRDERVLAAMRHVPRETFVPEKIKAKAYDDGPLPIGFGQTISQPYIVAYMTEALAIDPNDRVLEVGSGSGYQTAILAGLARNVYTIEIVKDLLEDAKEKLGGLGLKNIYFKQGDGSKGWPEFSPFDKIIVTAAASKIPDELVRELREGGRMVVPVGEQGGVQNLMVGIKKQSSLEILETMAVRFVPLVDFKNKN